MNNKNSQCPTNDKKKFGCPNLAITTIFRGLVIGAICTTNDFQKCSYFTLKELQKLIDNRLSSSVNYPGEQND